MMRISEMKKIFTLLIYVMTSLSAFSWGQKGHDIVAYIAEKNLTPATVASIDSLLDGKSLVYWANWLDNASHTTDYAYTKTWHYKNIDEEETFENAPNIQEGNIVDAIYLQINTLMDSSSSKDDKALAIKMLVHFLGDIHQPMHMGHSTDRGGNSYPILFFNKPTNLHSVWDTDLLEASHAWSHSEWHREIDRPGFIDTENTINGKTPEDWGKETYELCRKIYEITSPGINIEYNYVANWTPVIEIQLEKGALRLADVLNSIFDCEYKSKNSFVKAK